MGEVHDILAVKGRQATLTEWWDRAEAEAAANYLGDEDTSSVCLFSGFCQAALPHRKLASPADAWQITSEHITLIVDPGKRPGANGVPEPVGVPYGSRARLIMLYLQSEALSSSCREVQLGRSMRDWLGRMSVPVGGKQMAMIRDQAERISRCHLSFTIKSGRGERFEQQSIVEGAIFLTSEEGQGSLFPETAKLSEPFFRELQRHSVPLEEAAIRAIANNSMALDLYAWLAYRLHVLSRLPEVLRHAHAEPMVSGWTHPDRAIRRSVGRSVDACCERLSKRATPDFIGAFGQSPRLQKVSLLPSLPSMRVWNAARSIAGLSAILPDERRLRWSIANDPVVRARRLP
jgi:replication initiator protein